MAQYLAFYEAWTLAEAESTRSAESTTYLHLVILHHTTRYASRIKMQGEGRFERSLII